MTFRDGFNKLGNKVFGENGDIAYKSTMNSVVDMFGKIGSLRGGYRNDEGIAHEAMSLFEDAYKENPELAVKILFYARDCRGGMGEKLVFKSIAEKLLNDKNRENLILNNLNIIVEFGSWKDIIDLLLVTKNLHAKHMIGKFIYEQMCNDRKNMFVNEPISLLGKWLPTINSRSKNTREKARSILDILNESNGKIAIGYKKFCRDTRNYLNITEKHIAQQTFDKIDYSKVSSRCMLLFNHLFINKDKDRFESYMEDVKSGKVKINSKVLFPYEIVDKYADGDASEIYKINEVLEEQWKALPNYFLDKTLNIVPLVDTSGSMYGMPMMVSTSLGLYLAERNPNPNFKNLIIEFGADAHLYDISKKKTLMDKLLGFNWDCGNTNLQLALQKILKIGVDNNIHRDDMPNALLIISDMQFDRAIDGDGSSVMELMKKKFEEKGYTFPQIIFWNVNARDSFPTLNEDGVALVSGYSPSIMMSVVNMETLTPLDVVLKAVKTPRYDDIYWGGQAISIENIIATDIIINLENGKVLEEFIKYDWMYWNYFSDTDSLIRDIDGILYTSIQSVSLKKSLIRIIENHIDKTINI